MLNLKKQYVQDLEENFLPFWESAIDTIYGGVFTCFTNRGDQKVSDEKYIWSQGRFLWLSCKLLKSREKHSLKVSPIWEDAAEKTYHFLKTNAVMSNNHIVYAVERDGTKIPDQMDTSIFADCFYVIGCNAYAEYKDDVRIFEDAFIIYKSIKKRIEKNEFRSEPYPIPKNFLSHSIPMILLNVAQELYETAKKYKHFAEQELKEDVDGNLQVIMTTFREDNRIVEMLPKHKQYEGTLLARHMNPGHTLECIWFMAHSVEQLQIKDQEYYISYLTALATNALETGWDNKHGGILRFVDKDGGAPKGDRIETPFEDLITETWDTKLWWPHSEALYTTLLLAKLTNDGKWLSWYEKLAEYIFQTFPNEDESIGEWIQIRNRKGDPSEKVVALPVKDPFHIIRNYLLIIELLEDY